MMEHENERMNYSFESMDNSNGSEGYRQSSYDGSYHPNQDQDHNSNKKKNGIGGRMIALLVAVALVASIGGSALTSVINSISRKNEEANAKAAETMSSQTVEPAQDAQDGAQDTQSENGGYTIEKSQLPTSLSSNDTGKSLSPKEVYAMNVNACVGIATQITTNVWGQVASASASGSGFILTSDGYVVTNNHVVEGATSVTVKLYNGDEYDAEIVGTDEMNDVALLKIDATGLQTVTIGDSDQIEVGEEVIAIGNPLGELTFTMTAGVVSALDREINTDGKPINMLQTDVAINSGNSGGGMFNVLGQLMGIPSLKYTSSYMSQASIDNIGMCIPINVAKPLIREALEKYDGESVSKYLEDKAKEADINTTGDDVDSKPRLGVSVQTLDSTNNAVARQILPKGCLVTKVEDNSAAAAAGIQAGDIIVDVDGTVITSSEGLQEIIFSHAEGDTVQVKVYRAENVLDAKYISDIGDGEYIDMSVTLKVVASPAA